MRILVWIARMGMVLVLVAGGVLALGACGSAGGQSLPPATLRCLFHELPQPGTSTFTGGLSCQVTGAASDETSFALTYSENGAVCRGTLTRGSGACDVSFLITGPFSLGTVTGELLPSHRPLGTVTPSLAP
jgi:hypothetical protein